MQIEFLDEFGMLLNFFAKLIIKKYNPKIIAVIGGIAKSSTQKAIYTVLAHRKRTRFNRQLFEDEKDIPLTVVSNADALKVTAFFWPHVFFDAILNLLFHNSAYPEVFIFEITTEDQLIIKQLLKIFHPNMVVVTASGDMPLGVDTTSNKETAVKNRSKLLEILPSSGYAILNADDLAVLELKEKTRAKTITYGFNESSDISIVNYEIREEKVNIGDKHFIKPWGISFKLSYKGSLVPIRLNGCIGKIHAYVVAAACGTALSHGWNLVKVASYVDDYEPPSGRMKILSGIKNAFIIDDSYNASPFLMKEALIALKSVNTKRRIVVLGDMLEIGKYSPETHEEIGMFAGNFVDILLTVGPRGRFIAEGAKNGGLLANNIFSFDKSEEAAKKLQELLREGDLVLVKGATDLNMEKIIEEVEAEP